MNGKIKFRKRRIFLGIFVCLLLLTVSFFFLLKPDIFDRNKLPLQILGFISLVFYLPFLFSLLRILPRKNAILITDEFLIDNSRYESLGKIKWRDISKIQRLKKKSIQVFLKKEAFEAGKRNMLKRFLMFMGNWNYNKSIIISSAFLDCGIEELFETITLAYQDFKSKKKLHTTLSTSHPR